MLTELPQNESITDSPAKIKTPRIMMNPRLATLNKAYYFGEYGFSEYRKLRSSVIDEMTKDDENPPEDTERLINPPTGGTLKINPKKEPTETSTAVNKTQQQSAHTSPVKNDQQPGPSVLQFLWVSVAVILFIYMYTATLD